MVNIEPSWLGISYIKIFISKNFPYIEYICNKKPMLFFCHFTKNSKIHLEEYFLKYILEVLRKN